MRFLQLVGGALAAVIAMYLFVMPLCGCSTKAGAYASALKSDLKNLVTAQEAYFADHETFAGDLASLDSLFAPTTGVTIAILDADADSWTGRATHAALTSGSYAGADCVAVVGPTETVPRTTMKRRRPTAEQPVVCDMDGWQPIQSRWARWWWQAGR